VVPMGQIPDETACLVNAPPLSVDGDPVAVFFIGLWILHNDPLLGDFMSPRIR
jgi:hypothetical protein